MVGSTGETDTVRLGIKDDEIGGLWDRALAFGGLGLTDIKFTGTKEG